MRDCGVALRATNFDRAPCLWRGWRKCAPGFESDLGGPYFELRKIVAHIEHIYGKRLWMKVPEIEHTFFERLATEGRAQRLSGRFCTLSGVPDTRSREGFASCTCYSPHAQKNLVQPLNLLAALGKEAVATCERTRALHVTDSADLNGHQSTYSFGWSQHGSHGLLACQWISHAEVEFDRVPLTAVATTLLSASDLSGRLCGCSSAPTCGGV